MNLKWIKKISVLIFITISYKSYSAAPIILPAAPKIFGSNIDQFFKKPNNNLFVLWNNFIGTRMPIATSHPSNPFNLLNANINKLVMARTHAAPNLLIVDDPFTGNSIYSKNPLNPGVKAIALASNDILVTSTNSAITVTNIYNNLSTTLPFSAEITCIATSKEGQPYLAVALKTGVIFIYVIQDNAILTNVTSFQYGSPNVLVTSMCFSTISSMLLIGYSNGQVVQCNNINNPIKLKNKIFHKAIASIKKIDISNFDQYICILTARGGVSIYQLQNYPLFSYYSLYATINSIHPALITSINFFDGLPYLLISTASDIKLINFTNSNYIFSEQITLNNLNSITLCTARNSITMIESILDMVFFIDNNNLNKLIIPSFYYITALHTKEWIKTLKNKTVLSDYYFNVERNLLESNTTLDATLSNNQKNLIFTTADFQPLNTYGAIIPTWITTRNALIFGGTLAGIYGYYYLRSHPELLQKLTLGIGSTAAQAAKASANTIAPVVNTVAPLAEKAVSRIPKDAGTISAKRAAEIARAVAEANLFDTHQ